MENITPKPHPVEDDLKNKIETIRNMATTREAKALTLLVLLDEKPVSIFNVKEDQVDEVLGKCKSIGLSIKIVKEEESDENGKFQITVSKSPDLVDEMCEIVKKNPLDNKRFGELMGYPQTAIDTYPDEDRLVSFKDYFEIVKEHWHLFGFRISKEHAEEEISVLNRWRDLIFKYAPELLESKQK